MLLRLLPLPDAEPSQINYFQRASALVKKHQYSAALSDLGRAMALDPKFVKGQAFRARILKLTGACDAAQAELQAILAAHPAHKEALAEVPKVRRTCMRHTHEAWSSKGVMGARDEKRADTLW